MKLYVVCSTSWGESVYDVFKTKSKANKRLKEINNDIEREELHAYIKEYDFPANKTGLKEAFACGLILADCDSVGHIEGHERE